MVQGFAAAVVDQAEALINGLQIGDLKFIMHGGGDLREDLGRAGDPAVGGADVVRVKAGPGQIVAPGFQTMAQGTLRFQQILLLILVDGPHLKFTELFHQAVEEFRLVHQIIEDGLGAPPEHDPVPQGFPQQRSRQPYGENIAEVFLSSCFCGFGSFLFVGDDGGVEHFQGFLVGDAVLKKMSLGVLVIRFILIDGGNTDAAVGEDLAQGEPGLHHHVAGEVAPAVEGFPEVPFKLPGEGIGAP